MMSWEIPFCETEAKTLNNTFFFTRKMGENKTKRQRDVINSGQHSHSLKLFESKTCFPRY